MFSRFKAKEPPPPARKRNTNVNEDSIKTNAQLSAVVQILNTFKSSVDATSLELNPDSFLQLMQLQYNNTISKLFESVNGIFTTDNQSIENVAFIMSEVQARMEYALEQIESFRKTYENYQLLLQLMNNREVEFSVSGFDILLERLAGISHNIQIDKSFVGRKNNKYYVKGQEVSKDAMDEWIAMKRRNGEIIVPVMN